MNFATINPDTRVFDHAVSRLTRQELTVALALANPVTLCNTRSLKKMYKMIEASDREINALTTSGDRKAEINWPRNNKQDWYCSLKLYSFLQEGKATVDDVRAHLKLFTRSETRKTNLYNLVSASHANRSACGARDNNSGSQLLGETILLQVYTLAELELAISRIRTADNSPNSSSLDELYRSISTGFRDTMETLRRKLPEDLVKLVIEYL